VELQEQKNRHDQWNADKAEEMNPGAVVKPSVTPIRQFSLHYYISWRVKQRLLVELRPFYGTTFHGQLITNTLQFRRTVKQTPTCN
jgi:hypothetical protein